MPREINWPTYGYSVLELRATGWSGWPFCLVEIGVVVSHDVIVGLEMPVFEVTDTHKSIRCREYICIYFSFSRDGRDMSIRARVFVVHKDQYDDPQRGAGPSPTRTDSKTAK